MEDFQVTITLGSVQDKLLQLYRLRQDEELNAYMYNMIEKWLEMLHTEAKLLGESEDLLPESSSVCYWKLNSDCLEINYKDFYGNAGDAINGKIYLNLRWVWFENEFNAAIEKRISDATTTK